MFLHYFLLKKTNYLIFVFSLHLIWGTVNALGHLTEAYWRCVFQKKLTGHVSLGFSNRIAWFKKGKCDLIHINR